MVTTTEEKTFLAQAYHNESDDFSGKEGDDDGLFLPGEDDSEEELDPYGEPNEDGSSDDDLEEQEEETY